MTGTPAPAVVVTSYSIHLPADDRFATAAGLPPVATAAGLPAVTPGCPADQAYTLLGRKGLLYKEPATRLALCAAHRALCLPDGARPDVPLDPGTAVVAASNLGNVATVVDVTRAVAREGSRGVSPMAAPNASSNVVASSIAMWFRLAGPNLMVCSGETAGLDALALGALLLRARRADRVLVVGAEPDDETAVAVRGHAAGAPPLRAGAACVVLEPATRAVAPLATVTVGPTVRHRADVPPWPVPVVVGPGHLDPAAAWGDGYGFQGVLQTALATRLVAEGTDGVAVLCGGTDDGWRTALLAPPGGQP
ncbi:beta-ketoacyl synthase N-terminal-like domain-containing protein [Micromonospora rifamycinica]|uniref:3-oxoacyl-[acyl-carrier-protein] synthase II n=1 Tax=Micromonospora rifamycinica TaxID=291594 RepID=A0A109IJ26_9ACTN|nr:beta-ketoacyl synthase N-terminal-like domain-containing protein [Micromonospora rifamycinica]KWV31465.1 beta-ketoacyl synthase [Micromonospora rifamycinica]SCG48372.1 3-oxoacyl-[acyl-carrier-protein] synthase II [Micromonospora rifamycinica]